MEQFRNLSQVWSGMPVGRRVMLSAAAVISLAVVLGVGYWASQPDYRVLFSGLAPEDAAAISGKLQTQSIPYKLAGNGSTILVPAEQVAQARLEVVADGLPTKGGKGFELFDQTTLGLTPFTQQVNYQRALQSELSRTIMQIDPIIQARVHLVRPDPSPFIREQKPTTASVMLRLKPGTTLNKNIAAAIVALVARSVEGLGKENITLIDASGKMLSDEHDAETGAAGTQLDYRRELENYLSARAENLIAQVLGPGRGLVRVTADINFRKHREKKETYSPEGRVPISEKTVTTKSGSAGSSAKGVTGATANLSKSSGGGSGGGTNSQEETSQTEFVVSKVTQEFEDKMGSIERLTVAAFVDSSAASKDGKAPSVANLEEIIKQAVGFRKDRDEIKVTEARLPGVPAPEPDDGSLQNVQYWQNITNLVRQASIGVAALAGLGMGWMLLRRLLPPKATAPAAEKPKPQQAALDRLSSVALQDPQALARVLAHWLDDKKEQAPRAAA